MLDVNYIKTNYGKYDFIGRDIRGYSLPFVLKANDFDKDYGVTLFILDNLFLTEKAFHCAVKFLDKLKKILDDNIELLNEHKKNLIIKIKGKEMVYIYRNEFYEIMSYEIALSTDKQIFNGIDEDLHLKYIKLCKESEFATLETDLFDEIFYVYNEDDEGSLDCNLNCNLDMSKFIILIDNPVIFSKISSYIQRSNVENFISRGVLIIDKETTYICNSTNIGKNVVIEPNVYIGRDVTIRDNVRIHSFSYIEEVIIEDNVKIGPFARIRGGKYLSDEDLPKGFLSSRKKKSSIKENVKIGSFVEVKASKIGKGTKVSHLAYIGDSELGKDVNIGAGVVTCNYDGYKKYKTNIQDNVFVGSNSSLIAPIDIGKNSIIGASSFINQDMPDDSFAIGRSKQQTKKNKLSKK